MSRIITFNEKGRKITEVGDLNVTIEKCPEFEIQGTLYHLTTFTADGKIDKTKHVTDVNANKHYFFNTDGTGEADNLYGVQSEGMKGQNNYSLDKLPNAVIIFVKKYYGDLLKISSGSSK